MKTLKPIYQLYTHLCTGFYTRYFHTNSNRLLDERGIALPTTVITAVIALALVAGACGGSGDSSPFVPTDSSPFGLRDSSPFASPVSTHIEAGYRYTCSIVMTGAVKCWGVNQDGQLGNGDSTGDSNDRSADSPTPVSVIGIDGSTPSTSAIQVSAGTVHTCAILETRAVKCWGDNVYGQLGNSTYADSPTPVSVIGIDGLTPQTSAIQVSLGGRNTCAVLKTGAVKCWGRNGEGQLGTGTIRSSRSIPVSVIGIDGSTPQTSAIQLSVGKNHICAILTTGAVKCWGNNDFRKLGNGSRRNNSNTPVSVMGIDGSTPQASAIQVSIGEFHTCALLEAGAVKCWGRNVYGELGNGTTDGSSTPVSVIGIDGSTPPASAIQVSLGYDYTCAILETGAVKCWGWNNRGELGNGTKEYNSPIPVFVIEIDGSTSQTRAIQVSAGGAHTCALLETRAVKCWGRNVYGELGNGDSTGDRFDNSADSPTPVFVIGLDDSN